MALFLFYNEHFQIKIAILLLLLLFHAGICGLKREMQGEDGDYSVGND